MTAEFYSPTVLKKIMKSKFKISLILTSDQRREFEFRRFLEGLATQTTQCPMNLYFVNQSSKNIDFNLGNSDLNIDVISTGPLGLSSARNIGLSRLAPLDNSQEIIGFPDDDCWYSNDLLESVTKYFELNPEVNCICTNVFDPENQKSYGGRPINVERDVTFRNIFKLPISVGIFIRRNVFNTNQIHFKEYLGAGTRLGSGEETELISRLLESGCKIKYVGKIQVFHPVSDYIENDVLKHYKYACGFGHLVRTLLRRKHLSVLPFYLETFSRSLIGIIWFITNKIKRRVYMARIIGMIKGFLGAA